MPLNRFRITCFALSVAGFAPVVAQTYSPDLFRDLHWRCIGPFRGGRTRAATGIPDRPNLFYIGQVNGGVWRSDDYGRTWTPIFDDQPTQSIGAIAVAPFDPNLIYVASGEGLQRPDLSTGDGIYKSTDAGKTWTHLGLRDGQQIPALAIDPRDKNRLFAAVLGHPYGANPERGIFRSTDGAQTWKKVLYIDENTGASDVQIDLSNPDVIYASLWEARQGPWEFGNEYSGTHGGLFKSADGGETWRKLAGGLPNGLTQIYVAIAPSETKRLYAAAATGHEVGIYRSDDAGETWSRATTDRRPATRIGGGDLPVPKVDPKNPDVVYSASIVTWRSTDGGKTWTGIKGAPGGDDYQNIWINPDNPDIILLVGDQGAVVSVNGGRTWSSWYNQPTAQLYHAVATTNTFPYRVCGGQQESGSVCISSRGNDGAITFREWHPVGVIEYGYVAPDPLDPGIIYGAGRGQVSKFHWSTGQVELVTPNPLRDQKYRADRTQPIMFSPLDPHVLFYAANVLFKTTDGAHSWHAISPDLTRPHPGIPTNLGTMADKDSNEHRGVIYSLAPSFKNIDTLWAGTDEGLIWLTRDGGKNWADITPPALTPWSKVTQLAASHFDDQSAYASVSRFRIDDRRPYIYRTHDGGKTWKLITAGLAPDAPIDAVREDSVRQGLLFAGSETSVWVSFDDGGHWQSLQLNLPHTSMRDLWIHDQDLIVGTHGRSFWILDNITPLRQISLQTASSSAVLFQPAAASLVRRDTNTDTPLPPDEPAAGNPPDGAVLDYFLARPDLGTIALEISDAKGNLLRRYSSADRPELTATDPRELPIPPYWVRAPRILQASTGMHRWAWDLRSAPPDSLRHEFPISAIPFDTPRLPLGPRVPPGMYTAKLTANGVAQTVSLTVKMDPRVKASPAELAQQFEMETELASMLTRSTGAIRQAGSVREQIEKLSHQRQPSAPLPVAYEVLESKVSDALGHAQAGEQAANDVALNPVNGKISGLYRELDSADAAPTAAQQAALAVIRGEFARVMDRWKAVVETDISAFNRALNQAHLPEIRLNAKPAKESGEYEGFE
jgi:photosystem II stability/assembly factor-like uncharacterized protein